MNVLPDLHGQFMLAREAVDPPDGWHVRKSGDWSLAAHPSLPVVELRAADGSPAGLALGHIVDDEGCYVRGSLRLPVADPAGGSASLERWIYRHGGRFVFIVQMPAFSRLYLDAYGTLATVWCRERRRVASTTTLLLRDEPDHPLFRRKPTDFPACKPNLYVPADLTSAPGVRRVMVNHYLDLHRLEQHRHHPERLYEEACAHEIPGIVEAIHRTMQRLIGAAVRECGGAYLGLTAGADSRRLLACARPFADRLECVTLERDNADNDPGNPVDCETAAALARHVGVAHRTLRLETNDPQSALNYLLRIGFSGGKGKNGKFYLTPMRHLDMGRAWFTGHSGGLDRIYPEREDPFLAEPTASNLLKGIRLAKSKGLPEYRMVLEAVERWLDQAPKGTPRQRLKLARVEHRGGAWASAHLYGMAPFRMNMLPVAHREVVDGMCRLPRAYCRHDGLTRDLLELAWPALLDFPFNGESLGS